MAPAVKSIKLNRKGGIISVHASTTFSRFHIFGGEFIYTYTYDNSNPTLVNAQYEILEDGKESSFLLSSLAARLPHFDQDNQKFYALIAKYV